MSFFKPNFIQKEKRMKKITALIIISLSLSAASNAMIGSAEHFSTTLEKFISQGDIDTVKELLKNDILLSELPLEERGRLLGSAALNGNKEIFQTLLNNEQIQSCLNDSKAVHMILMGIGDSAEHKNNICLEIFDLVEPLNIFVNAGTVSTDECLIAATLHRSPKLVKKILENEQLCMKISDNGIRRALTSSPDTEDMVLPKEIISIFMSNSRVQTAQKRNTAIDRILKEANTSETN